MAKWESAPIVDQQQPVKGGWQDAPIVDQPGNEGVIPQGLSGVNEGMANLLSLPNSIELGARSIGPMIGNMFGGKFAMPTESVLPDAGKAYRTMATEIGAIKPETSDPVGKFSRRVGQELGANIIPSMGSPAKVTSLISTLGSGMGAATAEAVFPGNPAAELAGQIVGGGVPILAANALERRAMRNAAPSLDEVRADKTAAYKAADNLGAVYSPQAVDDLIAQMEAAGAKVNPIRHQKSASMLDDIRSLKGKPQTLSQLDELRQTISRDLIKSSDGGERFFGYEFNNTLDDFIAKAKATQMSAGDPVAATTAINDARALNTRYKKLEDLVRQLDKARTAAATSGSGGNLNNAIRQKLRQILDNPARTRGYTQEELAALENVVMQGRGEDFLRAIGKIAPGGNGLMTALNIGAIAQNPSMAIVSALAQGAKTAADRGTINKAKALEAMIARGGKNSVPLIAPKTASVAEALLIGQSANQNTPGKSVSDALYRRR